MHFSHIFLFVTVLFLWIFCSYRFSTENNWETTSNHPSVRPHTQTHEHPYTHNYFRGKPQATATTYGYTHTEKKRVQELRSQHIIGYSSFMNGFVITFKEFSFKYNLITFRFTWNSSNNNNNIQNKFLNWCKCHWYHFSFLYRTMPRLNDEILKLNFFSQNTPQMVSFPSVSLYAGVFTSLI